MNHRKRFVVTDVKWLTGSSKEEGGSSLFLRVYSSWRCFVYTDPAHCLYKCEVFCHINFIGPAPPALCLLIIHHLADCMPGNWARQRGWRKKLFLCKAQEMSPNTEGFRKKERSVKGKRTKTRGLVRSVVKWECLLKFSVWSQQELWCVLFWDGDVCFPVAHCGVF